MTVFLSYSWDDQAIVDRISNELLAKNIKVWKDRWSLAPGDRLDEKILARIRDCSYFCVVLSKSAVKSEWVAKELAAALQNERAQRSGFVLPLLIEDCEAPVALRDVVAIDFRADVERGIKLLIERIGRKYNTNFSGRLEDGRDYWFHYGQRTVHVGEATRFELDLVAFDIEAAYSVLAQVTIDEHAEVSAERPVADSGGESSARFLRRLLAQYPSDFAWIQLTSDDLYEHAFDMDPFGVYPKGTLLIRVVRLGAVPGNHQLFPLHRYIAQLCRNQGIELDHAP